MTLYGPRGVPVSTSQNLDDNSFAAIQRRAKDFENIPPPPQPLNPKTALVHAYYRTGLDRALLLVHVDGLMADARRLSLIANHYIAGCSCPHYGTHTCVPHSFAGEMQDPEVFGLCADHDHVEKGEPGA